MGANRVGVMGNNQSASRAETAAGAAEGRNLDAEILGDIDAWDVRQQDGWFRFNANMPGMPGARGYLKPCTGGDMLAETPGPVLSVLSLGGARRTRAFPGRGDFPYHVIAPADDIGAVGLAGIEDADPVDKAQLLREQTSDSLLAAELIRHRQLAGRGLPLVLARTETDRSASLGELGKGRALVNLLRALDNQKTIADTLGKMAKIACISLDFVPEDMAAGQEYAPALRLLLANLSKAVWERGMPATTFLAVFDTIAADKRQAQWDMAVHPSDPALIFSAPSYALAYDDYARLTEAGARDRAEIEAAALAEIEAGRGWACPSLLLAEWDHKRGRIRVRSNASLPLVLDEDDPFDAGKRCGFRVETEAGPLTVRKVEVDQKEPRDLLIKIREERPPSAMWLSYAWDGPGALRDEWEHPFGRSARRWALPARLEVHG